MPSLYPSSTTRPSEEPCEGPSGASFSKLFSKEDAMRNARHCLKEDLHYA